MMRVEMIDAETRVAEIGVLDEDRRDEGRRKEMKDVARMGAEKRTVELVTMIEEGQMINKTRTVAKKINAKKVKTIAGKKTKRKIKRKTKKRRRTISRQSARKR